MNEWTFCWCFGTPVSASALLLVLRHSCCVCSHILIGASALLLVLRHSCWCFGTPVGATALLLRGQPRFNRCFGTLVGASTLLLVLWHSCCVYRHVLVGTTIPQYCIIPSGTYCVASYSFLMIGLVVKQLYDKTLNK